MQQPVCRRREGDGHGSQKPDGNTGVAPDHAGSFVPAALGGPFLWPRPGVETEICPNLMTLGFRPGRSAHDALMALASSLRVARELPPVVALPERVGGPRDRQLPMRLTEGEADALREAAALRAGPLRVPPQGRLGVQGRP